MRNNENELTRRSFLALTAGASAGIAGCTGGGNDSDGGDGNGTDGTNGTDGSSLDDYTDNPYDLGDRPKPGGTSMDEMPDLSGELSLYLGRGEGGRYQDLLNFIQDKYSDFKLTVNQKPSALLANTIIEEQKAGSSRADVFWSIDAGSLGTVAEEGYTKKLPEDVLNIVGEEFRDSSGNWIGTAGRARAIPYNTNKFSESDIPNKVADFPGTSAFQGEIGWAPSYGAFQSFVTAMRLNKGPEATKEWLKGIKDLGVREFSDEFMLSNAISRGDVSVGFANHYYILRVQNSKENAPIDMTFTKNDAGALVNVAGAEIIKSTDKEDLAANFIRHLLSSEAQEYFATVTFSYPLISGVKPVGSIPTIDELNPPNIDLTKLSELQPTLELMREVGIRV